MISNYKPSDYEAEIASNSYVMSLVALIAGLPLPIVNLIATLIFFLSNRKAGYFVRWHCTQALLSQLSVFFLNSAGFWWTISIIFTDETISVKYLVYISFLIIFNIVESIATVFAAIDTRKGKHVEWFLLGSLTNILCKQPNYPELDHKQLNP
jgi:uncharacterized membrane protein